MTSSSTSGLLDGEQGGGAAGVAVLKPAREVLLKTVCKSMLRADLMGKNGKAAGPLGHLCPAPQTAWGWGGGLGPTPPQTQPFAEGAAVALLSGCDWNSKCPTTWLCSQGRLAAGQLGSCVSTPSHGLRLGKPAQVGAVKAPVCAVSAQHRRSTFSAFQTQAQKMLRGFFSDFPQET